jgi:hypothetical protein
MPRLCNWRATYANRSGPTRIPASTGIESDVAAAQFGPLAPLGRRGYGCIRDAEAKTNRRALDAQRPEQFQVAIHAMQRVGGDELGLQPRIDFAGGRPSEADPARRP